MLRFHLLWLVAVLCFSRIHSECIETELNFNFARVLPQVDSCPNQPKVLPNLTYSFKLAALLDINGVRLSVAKEIYAGFKVALVDLNQQSEQTGGAVTFSLSAEDTLGDGQRAKERAQGLNSLGYNVILGPASSEELFFVKPLSDRNNVVFVSPSSTTNTLGVDDNIYRYARLDNEQSVGHTSMMRKWNTRNLIPLWRNDVYGNGLKLKTEEIWIQSGGRVLGGVRYEYNTTDYSGIAATLAADVQRVGIANTAILAVSYDEWQPIFAAASAFPILAQVPWIVSESVTSVRTPSPGALAFGKMATIYGLTYRIPSSSWKDLVTARLQRFGIQFPSPFGYLAYDTAFAVGSALAFSRTQLTPAFNTSLGFISSFSYLSSGRMELGIVGDRVKLGTSDYDVERLGSNGWTSVGTYNADSGYLNFV